MGRCANHTGVAANHTLTDPGTPKQTLRTHRGGVSHARVVLRREVCASQHGATSAYHTALSFLVLRPSRTSAFALQTVVSAARSPQPGHRTLLRPRAHSPIHAEVTPVEHTHIVSGVLSGPSSALAGSALSWSCT